MKQLQQAAEAIIYKKDNYVLKDRIPKSYRIKILDDKIRKSRTKSEIKLLEKASRIINAPSPLTTSWAGGRGSGALEGGANNFKIKIPFIQGKKLSENLNKFPLSKQKQICKQIGEAIAKLHDANIIHGDLTTSNMILKDNEIYFIDFGLGYISHKLEDKAVDLHLLKQALEAKHFQHWGALFDEISKGYSKDNKTESKKVLERLKAVEKRGRYRH
ncbi:MAG: KEOPS complex kinase/ATPase Bud32 [Nanoarchaeota archaeon]|nr:KEOPS complex kinase/ATPase Bud32 [Nanoarchaeota archaeon]